LLAYLDDTLEPAEIKRIGQKVAESDPAQELINRIKKVTRRRRLTVPPDSGPGQRFDANVVAEYLDNELGPDEVAELEKLCLESDVHLAEMASCHQILTLVLGQPALVPPTARERMYGLVHGKEAIPSRKAVTTAAAAKVPSTDGEEEDVALLGLPAQLRSRAMPMLLPLVGVLLLAVLGVALYLAIPHEPTSERVAVGPSPGPGTSNAGKPPDDSASPRDITGGGSGGNSSTPAGDGGSAS
jgi:hypothetical protein